MDLNPAESSAQSQAAAVMAGLASLLPPTDSYHQELRQLSAALVPTPGPWQKVSENEHTNKIRALFQLSQELSEAGPACTFCVTQRFGQVALRGGRA